MSQTRQGRAETRNCEFKATYATPAFADALRNLMQAGGSNEDLHAEPFGEYIDWTRCEG